MDALTVVLSAGSGLAVGYGAAAMLGSSARKAIERSVQKKIDAAVVEAETRVRKELDSGNSGKKKGKGKGNKKDSTAASKELDKLKAEISELKAADKKSKESEKRLKEAEAQLTELKSENAELTKKYAALESERDEAVKAHEAELAKASEGQEPSDDALGKELEGAGGSLDEILAIFIKHQELKAALLADPSGIHIAKAGDAEVIDGAAAVASTLTGLPSQVNALLPLNDRFTFRMHDGEHAITGRTFESSGELIALLAVGAAPAQDDAMDATLSSLRNALQ